MTHTIESGSLRVTVDDHGAELVSVYDKERGCERIWSADPAVWNRHAPILFPFVGQVADRKYRYAGREYEMKTQHGFARDREFVYSAENEENGIITHSLISDEASLAIYPFTFELTVRHSLKSDRVLLVEWLVKNCGSEDMYYSIGGHPGFAVPVDSGIKRDQLYLQFRCMKDNGDINRLKYIRINSDGLAVSDKEYTLELEDGFCPITPDFFDNDALIFENPQFGMVSIALPDKSPYVTISCNNFPYVGIWSKPDGEFVCLEPWVGRTDDAGFDGELKDKTGECVLEPGKTARYEIEIQFHQV